MALDSRMALRAAFAGAFFLNGSKRSENAVSQKLELSSTQADAHAAAAQAAAGAVEARAALAAYAAYAARPEPGNPRAV